MTIVEIDSHKIFVSILVVSLSFMVFSLASVSISRADFSINGTVRDVNGTAVDGANVSVAVQVMGGQGPTTLGTNKTYTNVTGWFNLTVSGNSTTNYLYFLSITHTNASTNAIDFVGQILPTFPYAEFSNLVNVSYYLKPAGTINITVINASALGANNVTNSEFSYQVKDQKLGYPITGCSNSGSYSVLCYVPRDRNYSVMVYPAQGSSQRFVPVGFDWNNFTANESYTISNYSDSKYNVSTRVLSKQFNVSQSQAIITSYINSSAVGISGWDQLTMVPFLMEPGNMIFMTYGILPFNASAWFGMTGPAGGASDNYTTNLAYTFPNMSANVNFSLPYYQAETVKYILFAAGRNGSVNYGSYRNLTLSGSTGLNFTMYGLLGLSSNISQSYSLGGSARNVNTTRQTFQIVNSTNMSLSNINAHTETTVDYSNYGALQFTFMEDLSGNNNANLSLPLINVTGFKEMNVFSMSYAPKSIPSKTVAQIVANPNITLSSFNPQSIDGSVAATSIYVSIYKSNSTCDVPNPPTGCALTSSSNMQTFNPFSVIMGGGAVSFRMGMRSSGIEIHYVNVDMLASGPPDGMFDSATTNSTTGGFSSAMKFGSAGPKIYDYVLISMPYTKGNSTQTGLNDSGQVNMSIPVLYDESWNVIWNTTLNGTSGSLLAGNYSHYSARATEWGTLMGNTTCGTDGGVNATTPCYIDTTHERIWVRIPHFSGTSPTVSGGVITLTAAAATTTTTTSTSSSSGTSSTVISVGNDKVTKTYTSIISESPRKILESDLTNIGTKLTEIQINVKNRVTSVTIDIAKMPGAPADVTKTITNPVYQYIQINKTNLDDADMATSVIKFKVEKSWLANNSLSEDSVALYRYAGGQWNKLVTTKVGNDTTYVFYSAETPGFSYFAITGETQTAAPTTPPTTPPTAPPATTPTTPSTLAESKPDYTQYYYIVAGMIVLIVVVIFVLAKKGIIKLPRTAR